MLIVEGPDFVGKTTFAKSLLGATAMQRAGYVYKHFSRLPEGFNYYWGYMENAVPCSVQDRFHMSEIAYAFARGEKSPLTPWGYKMVDGYLRTMGAFTVVITANWALIRARLEGKPDDMYDADVIQRANDAFFGIATSIAWNDYKCDVDFHIHCTKEHPWPSASQLDNVLNAYQTRCDQWFQAQNLKPQRCVRLTS